MAAAKPTLTQMLVESLRSRIISGEIAPGEKLPSENELVAEHDVSRTIVREALMRLQAGGFIHTRRGAGSYALVPPSREGEDGHRPVARSLDDRLHLLSFRAAVESEAAALCAAAASDSLPDALERLVGQFERTAQHPADAMACDFEFHKTIAVSSGNPFMADAIRSLGPAMITMPPERLDAQGLTEGAMRDNIARVAGEHRLVIRAISEHDTSAAATAMRAHLLNSRYRLLEHLAVN